MNEQPESPKKEEEPGTFQAYANAALELIGVRRKARAEAAGASNRAAVLEAQAKINRGVRTRQFVASEFWKDDLLPWLQGECETAMRPWTPGSPDVPFSESRINATYFYSSGKAALVGLLLALLKRWIDEGEEAQRRHDYEEARRKSLSDAV